MKLVCGMNYSGCRDDKWYDRFQSLQCIPSVKSCVLRCFQLAEKSALPRGTRRQLTVKVCLTCLIFDTSTRRGLSICHSLIEPRGPCIKKQDESIAPFCTLMTGVVLLCSALLTLRCCAYLRGWLDLDSSSFAKWLIVLLQNRTFIWPFCLLIECWP